MTTRDELIAKYRAEAEAEAGRPLDDDEFETGSVFGPGDNPFAGEPDAEAKYRKMQQSIAVENDVGTNPAASAEPGTEDL